MSIGKQTIVEKLIETNDNGTNIVVWNESRIKRLAVIGGQSIEMRLIAPAREQSLVK